MMHPRCATVQSDADLARIIGSRIATLAIPPSRRDGRTDPWSADHIAEHRLAV
jgi:hypothetical protein